ncbi:uncharacterized protein LOC143277602 [Babylonia areolata]|uniref:uncharacterized protein LOC143277602 n=1 Tax=Babylonia areolata TaxID=304850 RepID=UPI003FD054A0
MQVTARLYNTSLPPSHTPPVTPEVQRLHATSTVVKETQGSGEVQQVVLFGDLSACFRVGLYGVFTEPLTVAATDGAVLGEAVSRLPSVCGQLVTATHLDGQSGFSASRVYTLTFPPSLGNVAEVEVLVEEGVWLGHVVITSLQGQPTQDNFRLVFGDAITTLIPVGASPEEVRHALKESAGVRCHDYLTKGLTLMDCEGGTGGSCGGVGVGVGDSEPLCGHRSARNPSTLFWHHGAIADAYEMSASNSTVGN